MNKDTTHKRRITSTVCIQASEDVGQSPAVPAGVVWRGLEAEVRTRMRGWLEDLLEEEVRTLLGRERSQRRETVRGCAGVAVDTSAVDADSEGAGGGYSNGYRNGYGKERHLCTSIGTVTLRRPRVRGLEERFVSRVLPLFKRHTREVAGILPELYLHGLSQGDFDLALRGLLGEGAPLSASSIARLKTSWQAEYEQWKQRPLGELRVVYLWVDGIYVKAGLEKEKAALLVAVAALEDGTKAVVAVESGQRESTQSWSSILRNLKERGMNCPKLVVGDGHLGIWGALANVFPEAREQRCWNHRIMNVLDRVSQKKQAVAKEMLSVIPYALTRKEAEQKKREFQKWAEQEGFGPAARLIEEDWERMLSFYSFPKEHWKHLRTTNPVESPFASVRLRTSAAKRYKKVDNATAVIWRLLMVAEKRFRKLCAPELLKDVIAGATYQDGIRVKENPDTPLEELAA